MAFVLTAQDIPRGMRTLEENFELGRRQFAEGMLKRQLQKIQEFYKERYGEQK